jgi:hypothetical protein
MKSLYVFLHTDLNAQGVLTHQLSPRLFPLLGLNMTHCGRSARVCQDGNDLSGSIKFRRMSWMADELLPASQGHAATSAHNKGSSYPSCRRRSSGSLSAPHGWLVTFRLYLRGNSPLGGPPEVNTALCEKHKHLLQPSVIEYFLHHPERSQVTTLTAFTANEWYCTSSSGRTGNSTPGILQAAAGLQGAERFGSATPVRQPVSSCRISFVGPEFQNKCIRRTSNLRHAFFRLFPN